MLEEGRLEENDQWLFSFNELILREFLYSNGLKLVKIIFSVSKKKVVM